MTELGTILKTALIRTAVAVAVAVVVVVAVGTGPADVDTTGPVDSEASYHCHAVGPADVDALPGNLTALNVPWHFTAGHSELCAPYAFRYTVERERAAIVAAGGYRP